MNRLNLVLLLIVPWAVEVWAHDNFVTNPNLPYPPGCAADPGRVAAYFVQDQPVQLYDHVSNEYSELRLDVWRASCSEVRRSVIWLRLTAARPPTRPLKLLLPYAAAVIPGGARLALRLAANPNGWGVNESEVRGFTVLDYQPGEIDYPAQKSWTYVLDNPMADNSWGVPAILDAEGYNGRFDLDLYYWGVGSDPWTVANVTVPATAELLATDVGMPLNGRLSGLWAIEGASDQGITLTIADRVAPVDTAATPRGEGPLVLIFQQYTYDADGDLLWLSGSADFPQGAREVTLPIVRVEEGEFLGDAAARRDVVGQVRIVANGCNDLDYEYDLSALGLGNGSRRLQRLFSLETAGYDCRDYAAKVAANR